MLKKAFLVAILFAMSLTCMAQEDSIRTQNLNDIVVMGVRTNASSPFAVQKISRKSLGNFAKTGKELPVLLAQTPGVMAWSDNGLGTGTSYLRIRGAGDSRINVTIDGVPLNSPEDQCVFWANMNSYSALLKGVQIQRGVGSSQNGDGAFGGTIALMTKNPAEQMSLEMNASYGSFNTYNIGISASSGLIREHLVIDAAYHETNTDGYIHGTAGRSGSYYGGIAWYNESRSMTIRYKNIGNFEETGQAWNGVVAGNDDYSMNIYNAIHTYGDLWKAGLGKYNNLYEHFNENWDDANSWTTNRYQLNDGSLWPRTTDNFWQDHNILSFAWRIDNRWSLTTSAHYTHGYGYYKEFRFDNKLSKFGLQNLTLPDGETIKRTDFVRKKGQHEDALGAFANVNFNTDRWDVVGGLTMQHFSSDHFGYLTYMANEALNKLYLSDGDYKYYDSDAWKDDQSAFVKATFHLFPHTSVFADMQYRHVKYRTDGYNDKFITMPDGQCIAQELDINETYHFFNPKGGLSFSNNGHQLFASVAVSHREPERNNFTDNGSYPFPKSERLCDFELGYNYANNKFHAGATLYYMNYKDQLVQTGQLSDIGENLTTNIASSYRTGIELTAGWNILPFMSIEGNAALSRNRIKDFTEYIPTYDDAWNEMEATIRKDIDATTAFSPSTIMNAFINIHAKGFEGIVHTNYVSRQYLDNTGCKARSLPSFSQTDISVSYTLVPRKRFYGIKEAAFSLNFNNIFNRHYAASGWAYSAIVGNEYPEDNRYYQIGYTPAAGFTLTGSIGLKF